jgi:hypothetical protein
VRPGAIVFGVFGLLLGGTALLLFLWDEEPLAYGLLGGAAAASFLTAIVLTLVPRAAPDWDADLVRAVPNTSWAAAAIGIGASLAAIGIVFGLYLVLIGAGVALAGIGGLIRERRAWRRDLPPYASGPLDPGGVSK